MTDQELLDKLIEQYGSQEELAAGLTRATGKTITTKRISNWHGRGISSGMRWQVMRLGQHMLDISDKQAEDFMSHGDIPA